MKALQRLKTPFTVKADYSLPFVFNLSVLVFIHHITFMPQRLLFFTTLFERHHVVSLLESQAILTGSALFLCSAMLLKNSNKFQRHGIPLKRRSTCVTVTVISIQMGYSFASRKMRHNINYLPKLLRILILNEKTKSFVTAVGHLNTTHGRDLAIQSKTLCQSQS